MIRVQFGINKHQTTTGEGRFIFILFFVFFVLRGEGDGGWDLHGFQ